jgi:aryl-alcohol dehydrogenase-like predicted oxidoreductase
LQRLAGGCEHVHVQPAARLIGNLAPTPAAAKAGLTSGSCGFNFCSGPRGRRSIIMQTIKLPSTDLFVSQLCYGGVSWGVRVTSERMDQLIGLFRDLGGNFIDTAHCYAHWLPGGFSGSSERALADYFRRNGGRDELTVATKGGIGSATGYRRVERSLSAERVGADIDDSLGRLETDVIDLYWLHTDDPSVSVEEIVDFLNAEIERGRIRWLGASNWTAGRIDAANKYAAANDLQGFAASQPQWTLAQPTAGSGGPVPGFFSAADFAAHDKSGLPVIPHTPTAHGYFAAEVDLDDSDFDNSVSQKRKERARQMGAEMNRPSTQIALAYLVCSPFPVVPILGTLNEDHLSDADAALDLRLTAEQRNWLDG